MPFKETKMLEFNQYHRFDKATSISYGDLECLLEYMDVKLIPKIHPQEESLRNQATETISFLKEKK